MCVCIHVPYCFLNTELPGYADWTLGINEHENNNNKIFNKNNEKGDDKQICFISLPSNICFIFIPSNIIIYDSTIIIQ